VDAYETAAKGWTFNLEFKPNMDDAMQRVYAWYQGDFMDRPPIRFSRHNAEYELRERTRTWPTLKDRWFDTEYVVGDFIEQTQTMRFNAETFPVFWPNLGPNVFAACYGGVDYEFGEVTAWTTVEHSGSGDDEFNYDAPTINWDSEYIRKLDEMTDYALELAKDRFMVGYTDIHPGMDWTVAIKGNDAILMGLVEEPEAVLALAQACETDFQKFYGRYHDKLLAAGQPSITWLNVPSFGRMHVPSADFSSMISDDHFNQFCRPALERECLSMTHNVFHVDGKGVARHTDDILSLPNLQGIQWVHGVGDDAPIMQWVPYIKKVQSAGKGIMLDITPDELDPIMAALRPDGLYLCIATESEDQELDIINKTLRWDRGILRRT